MKGNDLKTIFDEVGISIQKFVEMFGYKQRTIEKLIKYDSNVSKKLEKLINILIFVSSHKLEMESFKQFVKKTDRETLESIKQMIVNQLNEIGDDK